jgi:DNA-binding protein HU-beta
MTKQEVLKNVAAKAGITHKQAEAAIDAYADEVAALTQVGKDRITLSTIGFFKPVLKKGRSARMGRNPHTGAPLKIEATMDSVVIKFVPAK